MKRNACFILVLLAICSPVYAQRGGGSTDATRTTDQRIPAPIAPYMERASAADILAAPTLTIEGDQDDIDPTLVDALATLMVGRADIRSPYIVEQIRELPQHNLTVVHILVAHYIPSENKRKCYRLQYPIESLASMSWLRSGEPIRTRSVDGWVAIQLYTFETTPFSTSEKGIYANNPNWHVQDLTIEVPIR